MSSMGTHRLIDIQDRATWSAALADLPHGYAHTWESCHAMSISSGWTTYLYCWEGRTGRVVCPISERPFADAIDVVTPYGFNGFTGLGDLSDFPQLWYDFARSQGWVCGYIQMNPLLPPPFNYEARDHLTDKDVFVIDLEKEPDELFGAMARGRRNLMHRWRRGDGTITDDPQRIEDFGIGEIQRFLARREATSTFDIAEEAWRELLGAPNTLSLGAEISGEVGAVLMIGLGATSADALYMPSRPGDEDLTTPLMWEAFGRLREQGFSLYNLGGGLRPGDGIERFKRYLGGEPRTLHVLRQIYDQNTYAQMCDATGADAGDSDGYFPAYRRSAT